MNYNRCSVVASFAEQYHSTWTDDGHCATQLILNMDDTPVCQHMALVISNQEQFLENNAGEKTPDPIVISPDFIP